MNNDASPQNPVFLENLQVLRAVSAIAVVLFHLTIYTLPDVLGAPGLLWRGFKMGYSGVEIFFVISGFVMVFIHRKDFGSPGRSFKFLKSRFVRIFPVFWLALVLTVVGRVALGQDIPSLEDLLKAAILIPDFSDPVISVAWSLSFELIFYIIFCSIILNFRLGIVLVACWFLAVVVNFYLLDGHLTKSVIFSPYNLLFIFGIGAALIFDRIDFRSGSALILVGAAAFIFVGQSESYGLIRYNEGWRTIFFGAAAFAIVSGVAAIDLSNRVTPPRWMIALGDASYVIYLFHIPVMTVVAKVLGAVGLGGSTLPLPLAGGFIFAVAIGVSYVVHLIVEKPLLAWLKKRL